MSTVVDVPVSNPIYDASSMPGKSQDKYGRVFDNVLSQPDPVHWRICCVLESILYVAEKHNIKVWADYGTLLGLKRDKGVILWDYDADLGMFDEDRERLLAACKLERERGTITPLLVMDVEYYHDRGCMAAYLAKNAEHTEFWSDDICDIIFNVVDGDMVKSLQHEETLKDYPCAYNYMGKVSDVLPLQPDMLLGHRVWTWNNWQLPLDLTYGDWRTPLKDKSTWIHKDFHGPSVQQIPVYTIDSAEEFFRVKSSSAVPIILRQTALLNTTEQRFQEVLKNQKRELFGYTSTIEWDYNYEKGEQVLKLFKERKLPYNVVDAPVDDTSPLLGDWDAKAHEILGKEYADGALCYILTNAPCISHWHTDPEYEKNPGGWMKLCEGRKLWWALPKEHLKYLEARGHSVESVAKLSLSELMQLEHCYAWGKILVGEISGGDLLWFPAGCLHKVITLEHSWGWGGYI